MPAMPDYVIVNWEPMLHRLTPRDCGSFAQIWFNRTSTYQTACGQHVTGLLDDAAKHAVSCLRCLVRNS